MLALRKQSLKMFTLACFFAITITSFLLNYTNNTVAVSWDPKQIAYHVSEQVKKLLKYSRRVCNCHTCILDQEPLPWFDERFNLTMQPFLTTQNAFLPQDSYTWWLKLQGEKSSKDFNEAIQELFSFIPGKWEHLLERSSSRCRKCAVVGNSGNLRQSQYGQEIDAHDFVFRMNKAPTLNFELDVGSKTTHHFVYPESYRELAENVSMIVIPFKILDLRWVVSALTNGTINHTYVPVPRKIKANRDKIMIYHPMFIKYVYDNWLQHHGRYPSTGFLSIIFALHICDEDVVLAANLPDFKKGLDHFMEVKGVDLYGFGADGRGNWHHYWENNPSAGAFRQTGVHDADFESSVTQALASIAKVRIFKGR